MINSSVLRANLMSPSPDKLHSFFQEHLFDNRCLIQVAGEFEVMYVGRAASTADAGDYLLIIKRDKSLQVHGPKGVKPVNWQPCTDYLMSDIEDGRVVLTAERKSPVEVVKVVFLEVALAQALSFRDATGFVLNGSEAEMRAALARHPDLIEPGLMVLHEELPVGVGGVDLYAMDKLGQLVVVELTRGKATQEAVHQLNRYVLAVRQQKSHGVRGVLAAPAITYPAMAQLQALGLEFVEVTALPVEEKEVEQLPLF